ncbi:unnamed protein product [Toxocara canis]|uniref:Elongin-C n=1 Tax=Toxocara canis TaxID=6265 RepID=A0A183TYH6_TOXCA|nr:unnamed protein product [Toxocara canis]
MSQTIDTHGPVQQLLRYRASTGTTISITVTKLSTTIYEIACVFVWGKQSFRFVPNSDDTRISPELVVDLIAAYFRLQEEA